MIYDIHTHRKAANDAIINIAPGDEIAPGRYYSVSIHPWHSAESFDPALLEQAIAHDNVLAVGEAGFDGLCSVPLARQEEVFRVNATLAEKYGKPMILHVVKRQSDIVRLHRELQPSVPWIIHGFRGKPQQAMQLLNEGFYLSLGPKFNADALKIIPTDRLFIETDESEVPIADIAARAGVPLRDFTDFFKPR